MTVQSIQETLSGNALPDVEISVQLVHRIHGGDLEALNELFARYQERLRRIVRVRLGAGIRQGLESMDIVQEVNVVAVAKIHEFEPRDHASILRWLAAIAEHRIRDAYSHGKAAKRDRARETPIDPRTSDSEGGATPEPLVGDVTQPGDRASRAELIELVDQAVSELESADREVILLRDYSNADWESVRSALGRSSVGAAQELHRRAWIRLRKLLRPRLGTEAED